jgi:hypothetical protein
MERIRKYEIITRWNQQENQLVNALLSDDPQLIVNSLLDALNEGATAEELADIVAYAAAMRIVQFHTRNEFSDWDVVLHTFTNANAIHQGLRRVSTQELLRGVFDGAIRVYINRFLNVPLVSLPKSTKKIEEKKVSSRNDNTIFKEILSLLDKQQQVNQAAQLAVDYLYNNGTPDKFLAAIGKALLREDRNFHSIQMIEAAFRQYSILSAERDNNEDNRTRPTESYILLVAAARYLSAHSPTMRSQGHTYQIANQLYHGEHLFE